MQNGVARLAGGLLLLALGAVVAAVLAVPVRAAEPANPLDVQADSYEFVPETGRAVGSGNVRLVYQDVQLLCDHVELNVNTKDVAARGNVRLQRGTFAWRGDRIAGNLATREFTIGAFQAQTGVLYGKGQDGIHRADGVVEFNRAQLTTCEYVDNPHYCVSARRVVHRPDNTYTAYHAVIKIGAVPVFYLPVLYGDSSGLKGGFEIKPGYDSDWGAYLLLAKEWRLTKNVSTKLRLDLRSKNGVAAGNETQIVTDSSETRFLVYGLRDNDPPETTGGYNRRFDVERDRYRLRLYDRHALTDDLTLRLKLDALSDIDMLEDWFHSEYRHDPRPDSFLDLLYERERFALSLNLRPRLNDFQTEVERLPELRLDLPRQALGDSGLYYQGQTTFAKLQMRYRDFDRDRPLFLTAPADYEAARFDTVHFLYYPMDWRDRVQVVPRAGLRYTHYDQSSTAPLFITDLDNIFEIDDPDRPDTTVDMVNDYDDQGGSKSRVAGELGLELSGKLYRVWNHYQNPWLGIDGLRHIVQPFANYTFAPEPSEEREHLYFFDEIDRLTEQNFVRLGARQRLQTRREQQIYTLARLDLYADFHFAKEEMHDKGAGDLGAKFELTPTEMLKLWSTAMANLDRGEMNRFETGATFGDIKRLLVTVSYLYRNDFYSRTAYSMGSYLTDLGWSRPLARHYDRANYLTLTFQFPINQKTSGRIRYEFDLEEQKLARQLYELRRDLHCWMGALGFEEEEGDIRLLLVLYLKAFPDVRIDASM